MARLYKKLFSSTADLLNKEYPENVGDDFQVEVTKNFVSSEESEVKLTVTKDPDSSKVKIVLEPKRTALVKGHNLEFTGKFTNEGKHEGTIAVSKLLDGKLKATLKEAFEGAFNKYNVEAGVEFVDTNFSANGSVNFSGKSLIETIKLKGAVVAEKDELAIGVEVAATKKEEFALNSIAVRTERTGKDNITSFEANFSDKNSLIVGYQQKINDSLTGAADFKLCNHDGELSALARLGFIEKLDASSTFRSRVSVCSGKSQRLGLNWQKTFENKAKFSVGADLNVHQIMGSNVSKQDAHKFALSFSLD